MEKEVSGSIRRNAMKMIAVELCEYYSPIYVKRKDRIIKLNGNSVYFGAVDFLDTERHTYFQYKDYGKTWAFTQEELERAE